MQYSLRSISNIVAGKAIGDDTRNVQYVIFDTRKTLNPSSSIFVALKTHKRDGHDFIRDAYDRGIRCFLLADSSFLRGLEDVSGIQVESPLSALQQWASYHRMQHDLPVVGITGSNGKTTVKEWLTSLLSESHTIVKSPQSYNSQIGTSVSVLMIEDHHNLGIFEAGISRPYEMESIAPIIHCDLGIMTNIGDAHAAGFESREDKLKEKLALFRYAKSIIYCTDHKDIHDSLMSIYPNKSLVGWSLKEDPKASYQIHLRELEGSSRLIFSEGKQFSIPFLDHSSVENIIHAICCALQLDISEKLLQEQLHLLNPVPLRLELKQGLRDNLIVDDTYSLDISSLQASLEFLDRQAGGIPKAVILTELDDNTAANMEKLGSLIIAHDISEIYAIGDTKYLSSQLSKKTTFYSFRNPDELKEHLQREPISERALLIKGARRFQLERLSKELSIQSHETTLEINLGAMFHNLNTFRAVLHADTKIMAVLKASAYGSGSYELARDLEKYPVDYLAVAYIDEGVTLREKGIKLPIMILNPEVNGYHLLADYNLEPEIYDLQQLDGYLSFAKSFGSLSLPIHLKIDTGMNRLGIQESDLSEAIGYLRESKIVVKSILSHLAAGDDATKDNFTSSQLELFHSLSTRIETELACSCIKHVLNSTGIIRFHEHQYDMVRIGIGLYGIDTSNTWTERLQKVHTLSSTVFQIKTVRMGDSVGYGRQFSVERDTKIAVVGIGYADGILRSLSDGHLSCWIRGQRVKTIGKICMDILMLDITGNIGIRVGDRVEIFGPRMSIEAMAKQARTIPYEILSRISKRVQRVYVQ